MKVKVLQDFQDFKEDKKRTVNDEFTVSKERFEELNEKLKKFSDKPFIEEIKEKK